MNEHGEERWLSSRGWTQWYTEYLSLGLEGDYAYQVDDEWVFWESSL